MKRLFKFTDHYELQVIEFPTYFQSGWFYSLANVMPNMLIGKTLNFKVTNTSTFLTDKFALFADKY